MLKKFLNLRSIPIRVKVGAYKTRLKYDTR